MSEENRLPEYTFGRPSDYKPEYCQMLIEHMAKGGTFEGFAGVVNTTFKTLHNWAKKYPDFLHAKKLAFAKSKMFWDTIGLRIVISGRGNIKGWMYNMSNRFNWKESLDLNVGGQPGNPLNMNNVSIDVSKLTTDQLKAIQQAQIKKEDNAEDDMVIDVTPVKS